MFCKLRTKNKPFTYVFRSGFKRPPTSKSGTIFCHINGTLKCLPLKKNAKQYVKKRFIYIIGRLAGNELDQMLNFRNKKFCQNVSELMNILKYIPTKNNIDLPIRMIQVLDLFPPLLDGPRSYNYIYICFLFCFASSCNFSLNCLEEPWKWVLRIRVKCQVGF